MANFCFFAYELREKEKGLIFAERQKQKQLDSKIEELEALLNTKGRQENYRIRAEIDVLKKDSYKVNPSFSSSVRRRFSEGRALGSPALPSISSLSCYFSPGKPRERSLLTSIQMQCNVNKIEAGITKIDGEIDEIRKKIPYTVKPTQLLGQDRFRNQYWFFSDDPDAIYIRLWKKPGDSQAPEEWRCLKSQATVDALLRSLNLKAVREGNLFRKLSKISKHNHLDFLEKRRTLEDPLPEPQNILSEYLEDVMEYESMYQPKKSQRKINTRRTDITF